MTLRTTAPRAKSRWFALLAVVVICTGLLATAALATDTNNPPTFTYVNDTLGADDQPGQKDLNSQSSVSDGGFLWVSWKWDDTKWPGGNTGDACALFSTDGDQNINFAVCVTVGGNPAAQQTNSPRLYTCGDDKADRCTSPIALVAGPYVTACSTAIAAVDPYHSQGGNPANDTVATCHIDLSEVDATAATLINTCSYPSEQPNSDPSDCVLIVGSTITTLSSGSATWSATLNDSAAVTPSTATGAVTFRLYADATCSTLLWTSTPVALTGGSAATTNSTPGTNATGTNGRVITETTHPNGGTFYWTAEYVPASGSTVTGTTSACGEPTTVTKASVGGSAG
jgi:hypothetical protein